MNYNASLRIELNLRFRIMALQNCCKIELWGTYPPPIGGVSIHVYRLIHNLHKLDSSIILRNFGNSLPASNVPYVKQVSYRWLEFFLLLFRKKRVIHLHSNNLLAFALFILLGRRHKVGVTLHNQNLIKETSFIRKKIIQNFLRKADFVVLNDDNYMLRLCSHFHCLKNNFYVLPAFLPPDESEYLGLGEDILSFRKQHVFLLSANAYKLRYENGIDIYGFDLLIQLVKSLKEKGINVGLIFCLPMIGDMAYYQECLSLIKEMNIEDNILIVQKEIPNGFEVWKLSDLFIRPTFTDIEGISVKEALYCGTQAIASDVCKRPNETILFKNRNYRDLEEKVLNFYNSYTVSRKKNLIIDNQTVECLLRIYEKCKYIL